MICQVCHASLPNDAQFCSRCGSSTHEDSSDHAKSTATYLEGQAPLSPHTLLAKRYRIIRVAGRGGMGIVYEAEDTKLGRNVALKLLPPDLKIDQNARRRFIHEARAAASLESPYICNVHEIHDEGDNPFISMEFINGTSLRDKLNGGPLGIRRAIEIAIQVACGLQTAAQNGVIHRDIKSANIMITRNGHAKIMDFGLAKAGDSTLHTKSGAVMGTAAYMSPEQGRGENVDERTDIWSLGVVLYEMLSGQLPFQGETQASLIFAAIHNEPRPLKEFSPAVPEEVEAVVCKAMTKDRDDRYSSAGEMLLDLRNCLDILGPDIDQEIENFGSVQRNKLKTPVFLALAGIILIVVWFVGRPHDEADASAEQTVEHTQDDILKGVRIPPTPSSDKTLADAISNIRHLLTQGNLEQAQAAIGEAESAFPNSQELTALRADYQAVVSTRDQTAPRKARKEKSSPPGKRAASADDEVFARAVREGTISAYDSYLKEYPEGRNASKALELLKELGEAALEEKQRLAAELDDAAFQAVQTEGTPKSLMKYLEDFPSGRHSSEARDILTSLIGKPESEASSTSVKEDSQQRAAGSIEIIKVNGVEIPMAWIPPGTFKMGSINVEDGRNLRPAHSVTISKGFWIGVHEVTRSEWLAVMGDDPSKNPGTGMTPVDSVSWEDCQVFLEKLGRLTDRVFRLPTEAEWEYACRAGSSDNWYGDWYSISWHTANSKGAVHEVGLKRPNAFGLYDMIGNVWEWCQDWYETTYYRESPEIDPPGPSSGKAKSIRGGSWQSLPENAHCAVRNSVKSDARKNDLGFRLVCDERTSSPNR